MFTGIVKEVGTVARLRREPNLIKLEINCPLIRPQLKEGDSVAIEGCDLTVTSLLQNGFACDATLETLRRTTLGDLSVGSKVNLEPSLTPSTPISGHFVLGHIDGVGIVRSFKKMPNQAEITIEPPRELMRFIAEKGSIALSGVGLTIVSVTSDAFSCWIIPYTLEHTTLGGLRTNDRLNIEVDVIARYVVRALEARNSAQTGSITEEFMKEHGF